MNQKIDMGGGRMSIKVKRHTGKIISAPELTQEQKDKLWGSIVQAWTKKHPEKFRELIQGKKED